MDIRISDQCIITVADFSDEEIEVNGKIWKFDYSHRLGPTWLKKDGRERKNQNPNKKVWNEFEKWMIANKIKNE
jgi:hypothetical protein